MKDVLGQKIEIGHVVVYPVRRRSTMTLKIATVCEEPGKGTVVKKGLVALNDQGRRVIISRPDRVAVVTDFNKRKKRANVQL
jgi:hypothetical protein